MSGNKKASQKIDFISALKFSPGVVMDIVLGTVALNVLALALPMTLMQVYDRIINQRAIGTLMILVTGCAAAIILETIVHIARDRIASWCGARFEYQGVTSGFERLLRSTASHTEVERTIEHLQELNSFAVLKNSYFVRSIQTVIEIPFSLINLILVYYLVPGIAYFLVGLILFLLLTHLILYRAVFKAKKKEHAAHLRRDKSVMETFRFINMIRALTLEENVLRRIEMVQERFGWMNLRSLTLTSISTSILIIVPQVAIFGVLIIGADDVLKRLVTVGVLTTCMMLAGRCIAPVIALVSGWLQTQEKKEQEHNANKLLTLKPDHWNAEVSFPQLRGEVTFNHLMFSYHDGSTQMLCDLYLNVPANSMIAINSENDKASTTLSEIIVRNIPPLSGSIQYDEINMDDIPVNDFYRDVHYLSKEPAFFRGTILDNLASFDVLRYDDAYLIAKTLGLDEVIASFELGFGTFLDREGILAAPASLLLRMSIGRAVIRNPRVLVINNIESGMDIETKKFFTKSILYMKGKCTIICVTNNPPTLNLAQAVVNLKEISTVQNVEELKKQEERSNVI